MTSRTFYLIFDRESVDMTLDWLRASGLPCYAKEMGELRQALYDQVVEEFARRFDGRSITFTSITDVALPLISFRTAMAVFLPVDEAGETQREIIAVQVTPLGDSDLPTAKLCVSIVVNLADHVTRPTVS